MIRTAENVQVSNAYMHEIKSPQFKPIGFQVTLRDKSAVSATQEAAGGPDAVNPGQASCRLQSASRIDCDT